MMREASMAFTLREDLVLPDQDGAPVSLAQTVAESTGTLVLSYRGHW